MRGITFFKPCADSEPRTNLLIFYRGYTPALLHRFLIMVSFRLHSLSNKVLVRVAHFLLLFTLALAVALRASPDFQGISVGGKILKLSMFADDILLCISDPINSLESIISTLDRFATFAGFCVNYFKSTLMPLSINHSFFKSTQSLLNLLYAHPL